ncbi:hypothetical protein [Nocardia gamkensis]|uniref:Uncharacterized protein n=1 Tax=Nocardia gamkensis TaxID=352869 RepID=A0A7X6R3G1_9NOCA|nr:hypothetical protein [Nocardia gamkensis]NKY27221.1 hypothetical protein [Nocardia gamkensis]NQE65746.1 hypothetical protein [Nocardia gamkensis]
MTPTASPPPANPTTPFLVDRGAEAAGPMPSVISVHVQSVLTTVHEMASTAEED